MFETGAHGGQAQYAIREVGEADYVANYPFRAGGYVLSLLATALHDLVLRALSDGPKRLADLRREVGGPAQTTLRGNLRNLIGMGALEKRQSNGSGSLVDHALTPTGSELLLVGDSIESWLARAPGGPIRLESETGKAAIKALVNGWGSTMLRALASRPLSLTELDNLISAFSYPALERRLGAMRLAGFVGAVEGSGGGTPYAVTGWLRRAIAPLLAAVRCERRHMADATAPLTRLDIETILLLATPLVTLPPEAEGVTQLAVHGGDGSAWRSAGVRITVRDGKLVSCTSKLEPGLGSSIGGSAADWLDALVLGHSQRLQTCGSRAPLTRDIVDGLHRALFVF